MNTITITGNLGRDAEMASTQRGTAVAKFRVADSSKRGGEEHTNWWTCRVYGRRAEALGQYLTTGTKVAVSGTVRIRRGEGQHEGKTFVDVDVTDLELLSKRQDSDAYGPRQARQDAQAHGGGHYFNADDLESSDVPF
jgi:single-strand DNA-binding protein